MDNVWIQVSPNNMGSILAFALNSNSYIDALAKMNYMELARKTKTTSS